MRGLMLLSVMLIAGLAWGGPQIKALSADELENFEGLLVDIRQPWEWQETGIVTGARTITFESIDQFRRAIEPYLDDDTPVALICRSGNRTRAASQALARHLDQPVVDVAGGMLRLMGEGYQASTFQPSEGDCPEYC